MQTLDRLAYVQLCLSYPRAGGGNPAMVLLPDSVAGSSPRRRGRQADHRYLLVLPGAIPAQAGQT